MKRAKSVARPVKAIAPAVSGKKREAIVVDSYKLPEKAIADAQLYDDMERNFLKVPVDVQSPDLHTNCRLH